MFEKLEYTVAKRFQEAECVGFVTLRSRSNETRSNVNPRCPAAAATSSTPMAASVEIRLAELNDGICALHLADGIRRESHQVKPLCLIIKAEALHIHRVECGFFVWVRDDVQ